MAFVEGNFSYEVDPELDEVIDESPNSMVALRRVKWGDDEKSKYKVELRRWYLNSDGNEKAGKGCTMITEDGPGNLTVALAKHGFGDTRSIVSAIKDRNDFNFAMRRALTDKELDDIKNTSIPEHMLDPDYYDPKTIFIEDYEEE